LKQIKTKIADIKPHPKNPNTHSGYQVGELSNSLDVFDQVKNIVTWNGYILAGHGLVEAANKKGKKELYAVDVSDWDEEKALSFMAADNRLAELGFIDDNALSGLLNGLKNPLNTPGVDADFLDELSFLSDDFEIEKEQKEKIDINHGTTVRLVIFVKDISVIEKALSFTKKINRGEALVCVCEEYAKKR